VTSLANKRYIMRDVAPEEGEEAEFEAFGTPRACMADIVYRVGDTVMAVYPHTTTFYEARVVGTPKLERVYRLVFKGELQSVGIHAQHMMSI